MFQVEGSYALGQKNAHLMGWRQHGAGWHGRHVAVRHLAVVWRRALPLESVAPRLGVISKVVDTLDTSAHLKLRSIPPHIVHFRNAEDVGTDIPTRYGSFTCINLVHLLEIGGRYTKNRCPLCHLRRSLYNNAALVYVRAIVQNAHKSCRPEHSSGVCLNGATGCTI